MSMFQTRSNLVRMFGNGGAATAELSRHLHLHEESAVVEHL